MNSYNNNVPNEHNSELGKQSDYDATYTIERLFPIARASKRLEIGIDPANPPFKGFDCWNHYEVSWLNEKGKPCVGTAEIIYDCASPMIIESKSLKLYFNSLNNTSFKNSANVERIIRRDLSACVGMDVFVAIHPLDSLHDTTLHTHFKGECIDTLDINCSVYLVEPNFLTAHDELVEEVLYSDLLKSNCLVTNQPDWGSVQISYAGPKIDREGLLKYIVSFRNHNEFHEQCIERIFVDILRLCKPATLSVYGRYTRRGGLDINPYRASTNTTLPDRKNVRLVRQ